MIDFRRPRLEVKRLVVKKRYWYNYEIKAGSDSNPKS
jgi:hypothetical protein